MARNIGSKMTNDIIGDYLDWLYSEFIDPKKLDYRGFNGPDIKRNRKYKKLTSQLFDIPFVGSVGNDVNRALDGLEMRNDFLSFSDTEYSESEIRFLVSEIGDCSFLEMLVALAIRAEFLAWDVDSDINSTAVGWFWIMGANIGLDEWDDKRYVDYERSSPDVYAIATDVIQRRYKENGEGGLFPSQEPRQRDHELWYQLNTYIYERSYLQ